MLQNRSQSRTIISTQRSRRSEEGVTGSIPVAPTIQSPQTARFRYDANRAYPRGFPATQFSDLVSVGRWRVLVAIFGALSPHPKIPFPAAWLEREVRPCLRP